MTKNQALTVIGCGGREAGHSLSVSPDESRVGRKRTMTFLLEASTVPSHQCRDDGQQQTRPSITWKVNIALTELANEKAHVSAWNDPRDGGSLLKEHLDPIDRHGAYITPLFQYGGKWNRAAHCCLQMENCCYFVLSRSSCTIHDPTSGRRRCIGLSLALWALEQRVHHPRSCPETLITMGSGRWAVSYRCRIRFPPPNIVRYGEESNHNWVASPWGVHINDTFRNVSCHGSEYYLLCMVLHCSSGDTSRSRLLASLYFDLASHC